MFKFLSVLLILPILLCSQANTMIDLFSEATMVEIYKDGQIINLSEDEQKEFDNIFCSSLEGSVQMPAFGVSLDEITKEEMKSGIWIKFIFEKTIIKSEMPFDELLIHLEKDSYGINIIRGNSGVYEGRCYYLNLDNNLNALYSFIDGLKGLEQEVEVELESQDIKPTIIVSEDIDNDEKNKAKDKLNNPIKIDEDNDEESKNNNSLDENETMPKSQKELLEHLN